MSDTPTLWSSTVLHFLLQLRPMSMTDAVPESQSLSGRFAEEVRVQLARQGGSIRKLADEMGVSHVWLTRRVGPSRTVELTLEDAQRIARAAGLAIALDVTTP